jgi:hypothetical protein
MHHAMKFNFRPSRLVTQSGNVFENLYNNVFCFVLFIFLKKGIGQKELEKYPTRFCFEKKLEKSVPYFTHRKLDR